MKKQVELFKAHAMIGWFVASLVSLLCTGGFFRTPFYSIPFLLSLSSLVLSVRIVLNHADEIDSLFSK